MHRDTDLIHADRGAGSAPRSVAPQISPSSSYRGTREEFGASAIGVRDPEFYTRHGGPTHSHAERLIASLEGAETALLFSSGMAAMSGAILALVRAGDHIVLQTAHYGGTTHFVGDVLPQFGVSCTTVDQTDTAAFERAMRPNTRLVIAESPSNPKLTITNLSAVAGIAHARGARLIVDNTIATPINQRPIALGADLVMHSATKYLGGHADLLAGAIAGDRETVAEIWRMSLSLGAILGATDAWLLARGIRTLAMRVHRQNSSALSIAHYLQGHAQVTEVNYAGLPNHPQHALAASQMEGFGGVLSFRVRGGVEAAESVLGALEIFSRAPSLGGVESLAVRPCVMLSSVLSEEEFARRGVSADLIRLSIGIENVDDLIGDLERGLAARK